MLHVGTNNYKNTPEEISEGIINIINNIQERHPNVYIVLPVSHKLTCIDILVFICTIDGLLILKNI